MKCINENHDHTETVDGEVVPMVCVHCGEGLHYDSVANVYVHDDPSHTCWLHRMSLTAWQTDEHVTNPPTSCKSLPVEKDPRIHSREVVSAARDAASIMAPVFDENVWEWHDQDAGETYVPSVNQIHRRLVRMAQECIRVGLQSNADVSRNTGRLVVEWHNDSTTVLFHLETAAVVF